MNREEFQNKVSNLMNEQNFSYADASNQIIEEEMAKSDKRRLKEYEEREEAELNLRKNPNSKTVIIAVDEFCSKDKAMQEAVCEIKINKYHVITEISQHGVDKWLVASEFDISYNQALEILQSLDGGKYSSKEIESIISYTTPFDLRL